MPVSPEQNPNPEGDGPELAEGVLENTEVTEDNGIRPRPSDELEAPHQEGQTQKSVSTPCMPSKADMAEHRANGHLPYRSWCISCVSGRGVSSLHIQLDEKQPMDEVRMDSCFPTAACLS